jgi:hypothetical protein
MGFILARWLPLFIWVFMPWPLIELPVSLSWQMSHSCNPPSPQLHHEGKVLLWTSSHQWGSQAWLECAKLPLYCLCFPRFWSSLIPILISVLRMGYTFRYLVLARHQWLKPEILPIQMWRSWGSRFHLSQREKFTRPHLNRKSWVCWSMPVIPATMGSINRRMAVQASLSNKNQEPISKVTRAKKSWRRGSSITTSA